MVELKTLKDIEIETFFEGEIDWTPTDDLRQVAREWIKELKERDYDYVDGRDNVPINTKDLDDAKIKWIKHFFNLEDK